MDYLIIQNKSLFMAAEQYDPKKLNGRDAVLDFVAKLVAGELTNVDVIDENRYVRAVGNERGFKDSELE